MALGDVVDLQLELLERRFTLASKRSPRTMDGDDVSTSGGYIATVSGMMIAPDTPLATHGE